MEERIILTITANTEEEKIRIGNLIHEQLIGNQDYIDCNIILNIERATEVMLFIFEECKQFPDLKIFEPNRDKTESVYITIKKNNNDYGDLLESFYYQLVGNTDYINSNIILSDYSNYDINIGILIKDETKNVPTLILKDI